MNYGSNISLIEFKGINKMDSASSYPTITGYASIFNAVDKQGDVIMKGAFLASCQKHIKLLWQHDFSSPIGVVLDIFEDNIGLRMKAEINTSISDGQRAFALISQGAINSLSIGFYPKSYTYNDKNERIISDLDLVEISVVTFAANEMSLISSIKGEDDARCENKRNNTCKDILIKLNDISKKLDVI